MGDPIRAIFPCKTHGCSFKVARTSVSGLCTDCNDREYRKKKKMGVAAKKVVVAIPENLRRKVGATICSTGGCSNKLGQSLYRFCTQHLPS